MFIVIDVAHPSTALQRSLTHCTLVSRSETVTATTPDETELETVLMEEVWANIPAHVSDPHDA